MPRARGTRQRTFRLSAPASVRVPFPWLRSRQWVAVRHDLALPRAGQARGRELVRRRRTVPALLVGVAGQLAADRRGSPTQLPGDRAHRRAGPTPVRDEPPLVLRQVPRGPCRSVRCHGDHGRIVPLAPVPRGNGTPEQPPCPRPAVDPHEAAGLRVAHPPARRAWRTPPAAATGVPDPAPYDVTTAPPRRPPLT